MRRWGNSLGLRLPRAVAKDMNLDSGSEVDVRSNGQEIVIRRVPGKHSLEELVSRINESNRHAEVEIQPIRGKEAW